MSKFIVRKAYRGLEGPVRVGQVLDVKDHPSLTKERAAELTRGGMLEAYSDKMKAQARNQAFASPREPGRMVSPNAGGLVDLGWDPAKGDHGAGGTMTTGNATAGADEGAGEGAGAGDAGNGQGATTTAAPAGSSTSPAATPSSSPAAQAPKAQTSPAPSAGRRQRGTRPSS